MQNSERISIQARVRLPMLPNFLRLSDEVMVDVADLGEADLRSVGAAWTEALVVHAAKRRQYEQG